MEKKKVLDKGYIIFHEDGSTGSDLTVVNAARVSFNKKKYEMSEGDKGLIKFLARHGHTSPFRHCFLQFEIYAPLMVARQWWKYVVGSDYTDPMKAWNESSRRYITEIPTFHIPDQFRLVPEDKKQGSGGPVDSSTNQMLRAMLIDYIEEGERKYEKALQLGVAPEQARLFLPAYGMYVRFYWSASLQGVAHFLNQRLEEDAQKEIQDYAKEVRYFAEKRFPISIKELIK